MTGFHDKNRPTWEQMEKFAIDVFPASSFKPVGFRARKSAGPDEECTIDSAAEGRKEGEH
jgi:hypothetical protein